MHRLPIYCSHLITVIIGIIIYHYLVTTTKIIKPNNNNIPKSTNEQSNNNPTTLTTTTTKTSSTETTQIKESIITSSKSSTTMFDFESFRNKSPMLSKMILTTSNDDNSVVSPAVDPILQEVENEDWYKQPLTVLVIGASGDLAKKKTYPALFELWKAKLLPVNKTIIRGFARTPNSDEQLRSHLKPYLIKQHRGENEELVDDFLSLCFYNNGTGYDDWEAMRDIVASSNQHNLLVYLAVPPNVFGPACGAMKQVLADTNVTVPGFHRIILEKPFGNDTDSCKELLQVLKDQQWHESTLYRIDHYLGKEIVQSVPVFRRTNPWVEHLWNKDVISSVHIVFKEPFGTDGRGGYFDPYGIIRDILQNHLLQVLTLIAMDLPEKWSADEIRTAKVNVLNNIDPIKIDNVLLGQYDGYKMDPTIQNKNTTTPTYACVALNVNTPRWTGVPFIMEAGKALDTHLCEARMYFRGPKGTNNALVFRLQPHPTVYFTANMKTPGYSNLPVSTLMGVDYEQCTIPEAYTKLVLDVLRGQQANFVRDDELIAAWEIFTPLLHQTENNLNNNTNNTIQPLSYKQGTEGPTEREHFLSSMGIDAAELPIPSAL